MRTIDTFFVRCHATCMSLEVLVYDILEPLLMLVFRVAQKCIVKVT